jgi:endonuclease YncB( thermonuclease family)
MIIAVSDGDTLKAECDKQSVIIRLAEIDAPEVKQAYGKESTKSLTELCLNKQATVTAR